MVLVEETYGPIGTPVRGDIWTSRMYKLHNCAIEISTSVAPGAMHIISLAGHGRSSHEPLACM